MAQESQGARSRTKLIGKSTWFKRKGKKGSRKEERKGAGGKKTKEPTAAPRTTPSTVLFVEQTPNGELASRLREMLLKLEPTLGFTMKVVEKTGANLRSKFPLYNLWEGAACGRGDCIPCTQEAEFLQPCTTTSVVYENICRECNPGAGGKRELESVETTIPTAYVGETSRSVKERIGEHWSSYRSKGSESHLYKHQELHHGGAPQVLWSA